MNIARETLNRCLAACALAGIGLLGAALPGCAPGSTGNSAPVNSAPAPNSKAPAAPFKIALLTTDDINDHGWNQLAYEGLQYVKQHTGAQISNQVTRTAPDQLPAIREYADEKYDLVLCHGYEYGDKVTPIAAKYPATDFVVVSGSVKQAPNVASLVPRLEESTYLLGMVAGGMTKSNVVGLIGGQRLAVIASTFDAFTLGVHAINPRVKVLENYVDSFSDQNAGKAAAKALIAQDADVLFHNADQSGNGMFAAAKEAGNVWVFGSNSNQNQMAPQQCLASAVIEMPRAFLQVANSVKQKTFKPTMIELNVRNKNIKVEWNPALKSHIPAALMQKVVAAEARIDAGTLKIERKVS